MLDNASESANDERWVQHNSVLTRSNSQYAMMHACERRRRHFKFAPKAREEERETERAWLRISPFLPLSQSLIWATVLFLSLLSQNRIPKNNCSCFFRSERSTILSFLPMLSSQIHLLAWRKRNVNERDFIAWRTVSFCSCTEGQKKIRGQNEIVTEASSDRCQQHVFFFPSIFFVSPKFITVPLSDKSANQKILGKKKNCPNFYCVWHLRKSLHCGLDVWRILSGSIFG